MILELPEPSRFGSSTGKKWKKPQLYGLSGFIRVIGRMSSPERLDSWRCPRLDLFFDEIARGYIAKALEVYYQQPVLPQGCCFDCLSTHQHPASFVAIRLIPSSSSGSTVVCFYIMFNRYVLAVPVGSIFSIPPRAMQLYPNPSSHIAAM